MNNRIKELAEQAFDPINAMASEGVADRNTFNQTWFQLYNERFAELIIKECTDVIMTKDRYRREYFASVITKHFEDNQQDL
jgi:hypothetical protein